MNIYLISWDGGNQYDKCDSAVVFAPDEEAARNIMPQHNASLRGQGLDDTKYELVDWKEQERAPISEWARFPHEVEVTFLGYARLHVQRPGVVCASFNPG